MNIRPNRVPVVPPDLAALLAAADDAELLRIIGANRDSDRGWADAALMELHQRHVRFLYPVCRRICSVYLADESQTENLLNRTFWRVYRAAERFDPIRAGCLGDPERITRSVRSWIARQAHWLAKDIAGSTAVRRPCEEGGSELVDQVGQEDDELLECSDEVRAAIDRLPERDRHIVLASFFLTDGDTGRPVPPNENIDAYCAGRWGTTASNVRQIRGRALTSLREVLSPPHSPATVTR
jgi:DNA-directed RNA polymerase specialized sigma24 family protein